MKINATNRLSATSINAEFTPVQKEVFQKLDTLRKAMKFPTYNFYANWNPHGGKVTKQFKVLIDALVSALRPVNSIATLGLTSGTPTEFGRAYKHTNQRELTRAVVGPKYERVINDALAAVKKMQKPNDPAFQYLEFVAEIYPLLVKSWSFLIKEVKKEYDALPEEDGALNIKDFEAVSRVFRKVVEGIDGFKVVKPSAVPNLSAPVYSEHVKYLLNPANAKKVVVAYSDEGLAIFLRPSSYTSSSDDLSIGVLKFYRDMWTDFSRTGIDDGTEGIYDYTHIPSVIKSEVARARKLLEQARNSNQLPMGPCTINVTPEQQAKIIERLQMGKGYESVPSGFGTGYRFSLKKSRDSQAASKELSKLVGQPVYYTTFDYD